MMWAILSSYRRVSLSKLPATYETPTAKPEAISPSEPPNLPTLWWRKSDELKRQEASGKSTRPEKSVS